MATDSDLSQMQDPLGLLRLGYAKPLLQLQASRWRDGQVCDTPETIRLGFSITEELINSPADLERIELVGYSRGIARKGGSPVAYGPCSSGRKGLRPAQAATTRAVVSSFRAMCAAAAACGH